MGWRRSTGLATEYYANTHPSIGNYFMLTVGNVVTNDNAFSRVVGDDNIVRQLVATGKTWKSYAEDLLSPGYTGGDTGGYARKHNVFALLADVVNNPAQVSNLVPFTQFSADLAASALPNYSADGCGSQRRAHLPIVHRSIRRGRNTARPNTRPRYGGRVQYPLCQIQRPLSGYQ